LLGAAGKLCYSLCNALASRKAQEIPFGQFGFGEFVPFSWNSLGFGFATSGVTGLTSTTLGTVLTSGLDKRFVIQHKSIQ